MAKQIISEEFRRMQKLAGIITEEQLNIDDKFEAGDFVTYNEKIYMIQGIYPDDTMTIALANLSPSVGSPYGRLEVKISDVKKYTGKPEDIPVQSEALNKVIEDDGEDGEDESSIIAKLQAHSDSNAGGIHDKIQIKDITDNEEYPISKLDARSILMAYKLMTPEQQKVYLSKGINSMYYKSYEIVDVLRFLSSK